jgi:hypothetical protein
MKTRVYKTNDTHELVLGKSGTSSITLGGSLGGGTAVLQFPDGVGGYTNVASVGSEIAAGDTSTVSHGAGKPVFMTISGGSAINAVVSISAV